MNTSDAKSCKVVRGTHLCGSGMTKHDALLLAESEAEKARRGTNVRVVCEGGTFDGQTTALFRAPFWSGR